jgi:ferrous iron transport protein B
MVVDAANLARNLYLVMQLCELGRPLVLALNMMDVAAEAGVPVDGAALGRALGVPVVPTVARTGEGVADLVRAIAGVPGDMSALRRRLLALPVGLEGVEAARARWLLAAYAGGTLELTGASEAERAALAAVGVAAAAEAAKELVIGRYAEVDAVLAQIGHRGRTGAGDGPVVAHRQGPDAPGVGTVNFCRRSWRCCSSRSSRGPSP